MFLSQIIFIQFLLNSIQVKRPFHEVLFFILAMGAFAILFRMIEDWYTDCYGEKTNHIIHTKINEKMFEKAAKMDLECYENSEFYDLYIKASTESKDKIMSFLFTMAEAISCIFSVILTSSVMFSLDPIVIVFSFIPLIVSYTVEKKYTKTRYQFTMDNIPYKRKEDYVKRTVYLNDYAKEYRLYSIFNVMIEDFLESVKGIQENVKKYGVKMALLSFCNSFLKRVLIPLLSMIYIAFHMLVSKTLLIGDGLALINAVRRLTWMLFNITDSFIKVQELQLYAENLKRFLEYKPKLNPNEEGLLADSKKNELEIKNLSFTYPGQTKPVLKNINLKVHLGEKITLVGRNGAGKTTLIKLLMRLYDTTEGEISLNGKNIKEYQLDSYRELFGTIFQDCKVFSVSIAENILMKTPKNKNEETSVKKALDLAGFLDKLSTLDQGIHTVLTREFEENGTNLSGGENQKLAIARIFAKKCSIMVLDEPSSALDPISEYNMYEAMLKASEDKTVIFISHRLSSAVMADRVVLIDNGEIIEEGTHSELMKKSGIYAQMFLKQSENYADSAKEEVIG